MNLLIVESPTKAHHIQEFLGNGWVVKASMGHIRDLEMTGDNSYVRPPDFKMNYAADPKQRATIAGLKALARKASKVYLATDPDREGEAISWHLCQVLRIKPSEALRVTYTEITESAIKKAIANPRHVDMKLVAAQEVRRGLDRMVGWEVSGPLSRSIATKASAGRVQSPALRLVVEREAAIDQFVPTNYFGVVAEFTDPSIWTPPQKAGVWKATWQDGLRDGQYFQDKQFTDKLAKAVPSLDFKVVQVDSKVVKKAPPAPFTTSTMQMDGSRALKCGVEVIMKAAQSLFDSGAITYHRTDSPHLSSEGEQLIRKALTKGELPVVAYPRKWKAKGGAQGAHEAIRPTDPSQENAGKDALQRSLYALIRKRALASQMPDALYKQNSVTLSGIFDGKPVLFKGTGSVLTNKGWMALYNESQDNTTNAEAKNPVPSNKILSVGDILKAERGESVSKITKAPPRFTEATLISVLEDNGVGRPATYATIIKTLYARGYITKQAKTPNLEPTDTGKAVVTALTGRFDFADVDWTKGVETDLDNISEGKGNPRGLLQTVWDSLQVGLQDMNTVSTKKSRPKM
jgi:DNA topoisomerase-1